MRVTTPPVPLEYAPAAARLPAGLLFKPSLRSLALIALTALTILWLTRRHTPSHRRRDPRQLPFHRPPLHLSRQSPLHLRRPDRRLLVETFTTGKQPKPSSKPSTREEHYSPTPDGQRVGEIPPHRADDRSLRRPHWTTRRITPQPRRPRDQRSPHRRRHAYVHAQAGPAAAARSAPALPHDRARPASSIIRRTQRADSPAPWIPSCRSGISPPPSPPINSDPSPV